MMKMFCMAMLLTTLAACASRPPDNRQWHSISCSTFKQINFCQREALAICPDGYDIYNPRWSEAEQRRYLEIACKP